MSKKNLAQELEERHHFQLYKRFPITLEKGQNTKVWDSEGNEYIDALGGIAVNGCGHCHPKVVEAIKKQAENLIHCSNLYYNEPQSRLAEKLIALSGMDRVFFCNSGAEAVEGSLKLARKYGAGNGKDGPVYSFENCFHGRTLAAIAMGKEKYQEGFHPMPQGLQQLPFNDIDAARKAIDKNTKAVIIEPIQGEGGIIPAEKDFLAELRELCDQNNVLLIFDEIQCGMGRTGEIFAWQYFGVKPDIITIAKSLGGGFPIGAVLATDEAARAFDFGIHGTTFGGNPLACAAANAVLDTIEEEKLHRKARENGQYLIEQIIEKTKGIPGIKDIRGIGLMIGVQLDFKCGGVVNRMMQRGVLANCAAEYVIRLLPPLTISIDEINKVVAVMAASIKEGL